MVSCSVSECDVTRRNNPNKYTFHRFPTNSFLRKKWVRIINRESWTPKENSTVCSKHFESKCFVQRKHRRVLMKDSIPTLDVPINSLPPDANVDSNDEATDSDDPTNVTDYSGFNEDPDEEILPAASAVTVSQHQNSRYLIVGGTAGDEGAELEEIVIKEELTDEDKRQCRLCLSIGRRMKELGDLALLYRKMLFENNYKNTTIPSVMFELLACWECHAELRRVRRFQEKVRRANAAFETGQNNNCGNFSNLSTVLIGEASPKVEEEQTNIEVCAQNIKQEVCEEDVEETAIPDPLDSHQETVNPEMKPRYAEAPRELLITVAKDSTVQVETQAIMKRRETESKTQNSVPKRLRTDHNYAGPITSLEGTDPRSMEGLDCDSIFGKVKIEFEELQSTLEERRNKDSFKSMKYKCDSCVLGFSNYIRLQEHNRNFHDEEAGSCSCDVCDRRFDEPRQLSAHYRTHFVKFVCKLCDFECYTKTGRMMHFRKHKGTLAKGDANSMLRQMLTAQPGGSSRMLYP